MYPIRITADTENITTGRKMLLKRVLLVAGSDMATLALHDALTVTGNPIQKFKCPANDSREFEVCIPLNTGLSADITGTSPEAYITLD